MRLTQLSVGLLLSFILMAINPTIVQAKKYIVTMKDKTSFLQAYKELKAPMSIMANGKKEHLQLMGVSLKGAEALSHLNMFVIDSDSTKASMIQKLPNVMAVEEDVIFQGVDPKVNYRKIFRQSQITSDPPSEESTEQKLTWGQKAIGVEKAWTHTLGEGAKVLVMDTGIDKDHPEFQDNFVDGKNFFSSYYPRPS